MTQFCCSNPKEEIHVPEVFKDYLNAIKDFYFKERQIAVDSNFKVMLVLGSDDARNHKQDEIELAEQTFENLESKFKYDRVSAEASLKFLLSHKPKQ